MTSKGGEFDTATSLSDSFNIPSDDEDKFAMKILETLFTTTDLNFKTDLSDKEIKILTKLSTLSDLLNLPDLKTIVKEFKELRVSKSRQGRQELVQALVRAQQERIDRLSHFKKLMNF